MHQVKLDPTLCRIINIFRRVGIWRIEGESEFRKSCMRILYFLQYFSFFIYVLTGAYNAYASEDWNQLIFLIESEIDVSIMMVKLFYILWRKDEILKFLLYDTIVALCADDHCELGEVNKKIEKVTAFYKAYTITMYMGGFFVIVVPLTSIASNENMLPVFIRFTLESDYKTVLYCMAYLVGSVGSIMTIIYSFLMLFVWYIMCNYAIEYKLVGCRIRSLGTTSKSKNTYQKELLHLVRSHNNLFSTIEEFRSCFSTLFFLEITTAAIAICASTFSLSFMKPDNSFEMVVYIVRAIYSFFEIFLLMYLANEITIESDKISYCLFESNWIDQSESTKRSVTIFGEMIKRPQRLVIWIYPMNLEKFMSIVNGAYSMFNILKTFK